MSSRKLPWYVTAGAWLCLALLFLPLLFVAVQSFNGNKLGQSWGGFSTQWYVNLWSNSTMLLGTWNTLVVAVVSTILSTICGTLLAIGFYRTPWPRRIKNAIHSLIELPVVTPDILIAVTLVGAYGVLRQFSSAFEPGLLTMIIGHTSFQISFVTFVVLSRLVAIGPEQMEAARDLYASTFSAWRRVILPQLTTGIVAGALLAFTLSLDDFIISFFVSGPRSQTLPLLIYASLRRGLSPEIHALSTLIVAFTLTGILGAALYNNTLSQTSRAARITRHGLRILGILLLAVVIAIALKGRLSRPVESAEGKQVVTVLMYSEYIDPDMLTEFTQKTGYPIQLELYEAQEEMIGKLQASGAGQYDVIVASDVMIAQMVNLGLIQAMDSGKIPNRINISPRFLGAPYDPNNRYTWPYLWGTTGILYRDSTMNPDSMSWVSLFDPARVKGPFVMLDESRTLLSIGLNTLRLDPNSKKPNDIRNAANVLLTAKSSPRCLGFDGSAIGRDKVLAKVTYASVVFNGEAMAAIGEDSTLQFSIPKEGSSIWVDLMTLSATAPNPAGGYAFINYILDAEAGAKLANYIQYGSPNQASLPFITPEDLDNPVIYPDSSIMARLEFLSDPGSAARLFDEAWTTVKSR
jgi:spermidine/putrescine transport system substrate-binding protein